MTKRFSGPLKVGHLILSLLVLLGGGIVTVSIAWANINNQVDTLEKKAVKIESVLDERTKSFEDTMEQVKDAAFDIKIDIAKIQKDVEYLRERKDGE